MIPGIGFWTFTDGTGGGLIGTATNHITSVNAITDVTTIT